MVISAALYGHPLPTGPIKRQLRWPLILCQTFHQYFESHLYSSVRTKEGEHPCLSELSNVKYPSYIHTNILKHTHSNTHALRPSYAGLSHDKNEQVLNKFGSIYKKGSIHLFCLLPHAEKRNIRV